MTLIRTTLTVLALSMIVLASAATAADSAAGGFERIDAVVGEAITAGDLPGAVVLIGRGDGVLYERAYGHRVLGPSPEPMTTDTVFDLASLTKVVATAIAIMQLVEAGKLRLQAPVADYLPDFGANGKDGITVRQLLGHESGLRAGLTAAVLQDLKDRPQILRRIYDDKPIGRPGAKLLYSDLNFIVLGEVVAVTSGERLDDYARQHIFEPLAMGDTTFRPAASLKPRIAPTDAGRGEVADGIARRLDGVSGHAGVFGTAADLGRFCRMLLNGGELDGVRVLSPLSVQRLTTPAMRDTGSGVRGLGFDIDTDFSGARGDLFPFGSFGHTGHSGTSIWIDPQSGIYVILLANRLHPDGRGDVRALRAQIANIAAAAIVDTPRTISRVHAGIDVLRADGFAPLRGKRIGLLTHRPAIASDGRTTLEVLRDEPGLRLAAVFTPEHGLDADRDDKVDSGRDAQTGLPVFSLYGDTLRPAPETLAGLDVVVIDLVDVGSRYYTYLATMAYMLEAAAQLRIPIVVLDRPNPINGVAVEGPLPGAAAPPFTNYHPMPMRHGLTLGEAARLFNVENRIGADLTVIAAEGWGRRQWFDETGLPWVNPSPNIRNLTQALLYPGIGGIEGTAISVGRGTDAPFEQIGAPWIDGVRLAAELKSRGLPGIAFYPVTFTPAAPPYRDEVCRGVRLLITDREALRPVRVGLEVAAALHRLWGAAYYLDRKGEVFGSEAVRDAIVAGVDPAQIAAGWRADEDRWRERREPHLLYPR